MKRIITLITALMIAFSANAQKDSLMTVTQQNDGLNLNIAGFSVTLKGKEKKKKERYKPYGMNLFGIKFGSTQMLDSPYYGNWDNQGDFLNLSRKSFCIGLEPISWNVVLDRKKIVWVQMGISGTWHHYRFRNPVTLVNDKDGHLMPLTLGEDIKKTKMDTYYMGAVLGLAFRIGQVKLGVNATPEALIYSETRYRTVGKEKYKNEIDGLTPFRLKLGATMIIDWMGVFVDYGMHPIFKTGAGNDAKMISFGLKVGI